MATKKSQRIGILVIAIVMSIGTIGSFFVIILANKNNANDHKKFEQLQKEVQDISSKEYQPKVEAYQKKVSEFNDKLKKDNYETVLSYKKRAQPFDKDKTNKLDKVKTEDIKEGDGDEIKNPGDAQAFYIGWNTKGEIFDSSIDKDKNTLKDPFDPQFGINGWQQGVIGMKIGGIRELTIPAQLAYGEKGSGDKIPANEPLKFILFTVKKDGLKQPEIPEKLKKKYEELQKIMPSGYPGAGVQ